MSVSSSSSSNPLNVEDIVISDEVKKDIARLRNRKYVQKCREKNRKQTLNQLEELNIKMDKIICELQQLKKQVNGYI